MMYITRKSFFTTTAFFLFTMVMITCSIMSIGIATAQETLNIRLTVKEAAGVGSNEFPITTVVPMAEGKYQDTSSFHLVDSSGNTVPAQFEILNRWWSRDNSIRHIAVHFQPSVSAFTSTGTGIANYYLRDDGSGNYASAPIAVTETLSDITVNTGVLKFIVNKNHFNMLDQAWLDLNNDRSFEANEKMISSSPFNGGLMVPRKENTTGSQYDSSRTDLHVSVEENGPMRVVIRAEALTNYQSTTNHTHGWAVRIYAYAGKPYIKIDYQLQNSAKNAMYAWPLYFESMDMNFKLNLDGNPTIKFGTGDGKVYERTRNNGIYLAQKRHDAFEIVDAGNNNKLLSGTIPEGFISVNDGQKGVTAITRNFWQMWPNGLKVNSDNTLSIQLFPDWSAQFCYNEAQGTYAINTTGLYWLEDMQHIYKETLLFFHKPDIMNTELVRLAKTFQYHPVAIIPIEHYRETKASLDLAGIVPENQYLDMNAEDLRVPSYQSSLYDISSIDQYQFGWDNFDIDVDRKESPDIPGGWPDGNVKFILSGNPADYFNAEDYAMGELNIRPQWMTDYRHDNDWSFLQLSENPYGGGSWRRFEGWNTPWFDADYLNGTKQDASSRDDEHGWFYHVEDAYYLTGNPWIEDWYKFIAEFRQVRLNNLDPWPNMSSRAVGHSIAHSMQAYTITGASKVLPAFQDFVSYLRELQDPIYGDKPSLQEGEAAFQAGYMTRAVIRFMEEVRGIDWQAYAEAFQFIAGYMAWNLNYSNFAYYIDASTGEIGESNATGLTMVDPQMWYYWNSGKKEFFNHTEQYLTSGINGGQKPYGNFENWGGQYEGRYYLFVKNTPRNDTTPPAAITDLKATLYGTDLMLSWTAPKNDDLERYHIVWSTKPISAIQTTDRNKTNWWAAHVVGPNLAPKAGEKHVFTIPSVSEKAVYVAIFTFDQQQNMSAMSNLAATDVSSVEPEKFTLSVIKEGNGSGNVVSEPINIDCGTVCSDAFTEGTIVTLTVHPEPGSTFDGWTGAGCGGTNTCMVMINQAKQVSATFSRKPIFHTLRVEKIGEGTGTIISEPVGIECGSECSEVSAEFEEGTLLKLSATPRPGSLWAGWSGNGCSGTGECVVFLNREITIMAIFDPDNGDVSLLQEQMLSIDRGDGASALFIARGDTITYSLTATNFFESDVSLLISDALNGFVEYLSNTLRINGEEIANDDRYFDNALFQYSSNWLTTGQSLTISFDVLVTDNALSEELIENFFVVSAYFKEWDTPIISNKMSNLLQVQVIDPVPEPSTIALVTLGGLGILVLRKRTMRKGK